MNERDAVTARLASLFDEWADAPAIQFVEDERSRWTTWGDIGHVHENLRTLLADEGAPPAAASCLVGRQRPVVLAVELALLASGRTASLLSPLQPDQVLASDVVASGFDVVFAHSAEWARDGFADAVADRGALGVEVDDDFGLTARYRPPSWRPVEHDAVADGAALTVLTSGTTGRPKRLPVTWASFVRLGGGAPGRPPGAGRGALILSLPITTLGGLLSLARLVFGGRPIAMTERFDVHTWAALVREHRPTVIGAPPPAVQMILDAGIPADHFHGVTAFMTASAPVDPDTARAFEERYGIPVLVGYGATEFLGSVTGWTEQLWAEFGGDKRGSVGRALPGVRLRVVDEDAGDARELGPGEVGLLEVDPPDRAGELPSGWLQTSDRARIDRDGFLWILGRTDGVIVRGGFKVELAPVEEALREHPSVRDVSVVGLPDARLGQVPAALLLVDDDVTDEQLAGWLRDRVPAHAVPVRFHRADRIPRTGTFKIDLVAVRERLLAAPDRD